MMGDNTSGTVFRWVMPVLKAIPNADDGTILHAGIASDVSEDLEGDVMDQELVAKSYAVLERYGKFNWDHNGDPPEDIGDVFGCRHITEEEARERFGIVIKGAGTALWGNVYPLVGGGLDSENLKRAHHRLRAGARLGYSLDGVCVRNAAGRIAKAFFHQVAITPQPMNMSTFCARITKSLTGVAEDIGISEDVLPEVLSDMPGPPMIMLDGGIGEHQGLSSDQVRITKTLFAALVRAAFGPRNAPPHGTLAEALRRRQRARKGLLEAIYEARERR